MKIPIELSHAMFKHAGVSRENLHEVLSRMAPLYLKGEFRKEWTPDNPTRNFCYVVAEWLIHYVAPPGSFAFRVAIPGEKAKHYFVRWADGTIVDLTAEQFENWELVDYAAAKKCSFMYPSPSARARMLDAMMHTQNFVTEFGKV
jgi:hypothetical protein